MIFGEFLSNGTVWNTPLRAYDVIIIGYQRREDPPMTNEKIEVHSIDKIGKAPCVDIA
jgi:hypothetical protein